MAGIRCTELAVRYLVEPTASAGATQLTIYCRVDMRYDTTHNISVMLPPIEVDLLNITITATASIWHLAFAILETLLKELWSRTT